MGTSTVEVTAIPRVHRGTSPGTPRTTSGDEVVVASCDRAAVPTVQVSDRFPVFLGEEPCSCRCISATLMPVLLSQDQLPPFGDPLDQAVPWVGENDPAPRVHDTADFWPSRFAGDGPRPVSFAWCGSLSGSVRTFVRGLPQSGVRTAARVPAKAVKVCRLCLVGRGVPHRVDTGMRIGLQRLRGCGVLRPSLGTDVPACRAPERFRTSFGIRG